MREANLRAATAAQHRTREVVWEKSAKWRRLSSRLWCGLIRQAR